MKKRPATHYFRSGRVERWKKDRRGYVWVEGYTGLNWDTAQWMFPPLTYREARATEKADGRRAVFHDSEVEAFAAWCKEARVESDGG